MDAKALSASVGEEHRRDAVCPNLDRLTVGVDLGDQWSTYCILGLQGETLAEGQMRTRQREVAEFFRALTGAHVVIEVGTHSAWVVREAIAKCGHEVLVANPRRMEGFTPAQCAQKCAQLLNLPVVPAVDFAPWSGCVH
ncbi:MAG: transposase [Acidobacteriaceae bacterium]|jgi:hypothetical protein|nr:transposase [Acidobacteriaceae bacterium]